MKCNWFVSSAIYFSRAIYESSFRGAVTRWTGWSLSGHCGVEHIVISSQSFGDCHRDSLTFAVTVNKQFIFKFPIRKNDRDGRCVI